MSSLESLVSEFIFNPVLRQARRFSYGPAPESGAIVPEPPQNPSSSREGSFTLVENAVICEENEHEHTSPDSVQHPVSETSASLAASSPTPETLPQENMAINRNQAEPAAPNPTIETLAQPQAGTTLSSPTAIDRRTMLPEDDGMGLLRQRILAIQSREDIQQDDKARLMHSVLMEGYNQSRGTAPVIHQPVSPSTAAVTEKSRAKGPLGSALSFLNHLAESQGAIKVNLTEEDLQPTFVPAEPMGSPTFEDHTGGGDMADSRTNNTLGCEHYRRKVKMQCATCQRWYTCRLCHDKIEDHILPRRETKNMLCMVCGCAQRVSSTCVKCGVMAARYYCDVCKLWNDDPDKSIYHCDKCGICRVGHGIGYDFVHCDKCMACINISIAETHKCIERSLDCNCPICGEYMFSSRNKVVFMLCGHSIHKTCYDDHIKSSYKCPICSKSVVNMDIQFRHYDAAIQSQPMPAEYRDTRAIVTCNDCSAKSQTAYHWLGLKCSVCRSYNTIPVQILNAPTNAALAESPLHGPGLDAALLSSSGVGAVLASMPQDRTPSTEAAAIEPSEQLSRSVILAPPVAAMEIPRNSTTTRPGTSTGQEGDVPSFSPYMIPDRMARSVSPIPVIGGPEEDEEEREARVFWGGDVNGNILMAGGESCDSGEEDDCSESEDDDDLDGDEEEDEEDEILLFGHR